MNGLRLLGDGLERQPDGHYTARVANGSGYSLAVDNRYMGWQGVRPGGERCEVHPAVAAFLQGQLPKSERRSR